MASKSLVNKLTAQLDRIDNSADELDNDDAKALLKAVTKAIDSVISAEGSDDEDDKPKKKKASKEVEENDNDDAEEDKPKRRGRPAKVKDEDEDSAPKKRGRPAKVKEEEAEEEELDYDEMSKKDLRILMEKRNLPIKGDKDERVAALKQYDKNKDRLMKKDVKHLLKLGRTNDIELKVDGRIKDEEKQKAKLVAALLSEGVTGA